MELRLFNQHSYIYIHTNSMWNYIWGTWTSFTSCLGLHQGRVKWPLPPKETIWWDQMSSNLCGTWNTFETLWESEVWVWVSTFGDLMFFSKCPFVSIESYMLEMAEESWLVIWNIIFVYFLMGWWWWWWVYILYHHHFFHSTWDDDDPRWRQDVSGCSDGVEATSQPILFGKLTVC